MDLLWLMLLIVLTLALLAYTTMSFVGGVYANRAALPIMGLMFIAILIFGAVW